MSNIRYINDKLFPYWGTRIRVVGVFSGVGRRKNGKKALSFENIVCAETGELLRDHAWINEEEFSYMMKLGDEVSFESHIGWYERKNGGLAQLGLGFYCCNHFWTESHGNTVELPWSTAMRQEVAA